MKYQSAYMLKVAVLIAWGIAILAAIVLIGPHRLLDDYGHLTPQGIRDFVSSFGLLSAVIYVALQVVRSFLFVPVTPLTIAGGYLFDPVTGFALALTGRTIISATITFCLSRYLLRDYVRARIKDRYAGWDRRLEKDGIFYVALMRVTPLFPFDAVGYVSGASGVSYRKYMAGTIIGDLPGVVVLTIFGSSLSRPGSTLFYVAIIIALVAVGISGLYFKLFLNKNVREKTV